MAIGVVGVGIALVTGHYWLDSGGGSDQKVVGHSTKPDHPTAVRPSRTQRPRPSAASAAKPPPSRSKLPPATSAGAPLLGLTIAVDPGHNGGNAANPEEINRLVPAGANGTVKPCNTTGTETDDGQLTEAQFNWYVAIDLVSRLEKLGARVVLTRQSNTGVGPCVNERAAIANRAHAAADVAIHADGNYAQDAHGFDVIHATTEEMVAPFMAGPSRRLAEDIRNALETAGVAPANYVGREGLDARSDLAGLNLARVPAILVELGNMRSASEAAKLERSSYRSKLAGAIVTGLFAFLHRS